ncbi:unnamed protein product, partial [Tilletia laevis]
EEGGTTTVTGRTITTKADSLDFRMRWTVEEAPIVGGIYSMCVWVGFDKDGLVFEMIDGRVELRPGEVETEEYMENQLFKQAWRVRSAGKVIESKARSFTLESRVNTANGVLTTITHYLVPNTKRWEKYKPVGMGEFIGARGSVETLQTVEGEPRLVVGLEELRNGVREVDTPTQAEGGKQGTTAKNAWTARSKAVSDGKKVAVTARADGATANGNEAGPSGSKVLTEEAFQLMMRKRNRDDNAAGDETEKRARVEDCG